jgi:Trp operon repressor
MKIKIPQIRIIPTDTGFVRGQRDVAFDLNTKNAGEFGSQKLDNSFLKRQSDFYMKLDDYDLYTLSSYTNRSHQWITPFIRSGKLPGTAELKMVVQDGLLAPLFFQIKKMADQKVKLFGKKSLSKEMFSDKNHREYVRNMFTDPNTPLGNRYKAYQMLLRGNDFSDRTMKMALNTYVKDLTRILKSSPKTTENTTVFRGVLTNTLCDKKSFSSKEFISTSLAMEIAGAYSETKNGKGRLQRIFVPKGSNVLALCLVNPFGDSGELEILLPPGKYNVISKGITRELKGMKVTTNNIRKT